MNKKSILIMLLFTIVSFSATIGLKRKDQIKNTANLQQVAAGLSVYGTAEGSFNANMGAAIAGLGAAGYGMVAVAVTCPACAVAAGVYGL